MSNQMMIDFFMETLIFEYLEYILFKIIKINSGSGCTLIKYLKWFYGSELEK